MSAPSASPRIDLNCDMGESFGAWQMGDDANVMPLITSANIACGFHGGDPTTIRTTV
ncbi:MAG: LamB/YcsF family protein, partial [Casimicrobiaceae bacterium]